MEIANRRGKSRHSGIPGFQQYFKSKSENYMNNNWNKIQPQQEKTISIQQQQLEETISIQQQQQEKTISIQQQLEKTISIQQQQEKTISIQQQPPKCIMTEEGYDDVRYMLDSFECIIDGYPCIINKLKEDDSLAKYVKRLRDISFYHGCNQESTMETLDLVKYKLEDLKELQSRNIITNTVEKIKEKFVRIFYQ